MKRIAIDKVRVERGDNAWNIAKAITGDGSRWEELIEANPQKPTARSGNFETLVAGEILFLPLTWPETPIDRGEPSPQLAPRPASPPGGDNAGDIGSPLPYGWTKNDLAIVDQVAKQLGFTGAEDLLAVWYSESGLIPNRVGHDPVNPNQVYYGLNMAKPNIIEPEMGWPQGVWVTITQDAPIATQLQALAQFYDHMAKRYLGESYAARAAKLGVTPSAMIYMMNFLPGLVSMAKTGDVVLGRKDDPTPLPIKGSTLTYGAIYKANPGLDRDKDGLITPKDFDALVASNRQTLASASPAKDLLAAAKSLGPPQSLATLFAPITNQWEQLTGKAPIVAVGFGPNQNGAAAAAAGGGGLLLAGGLMFAAWYFFLRKKKGR